MKTSHLSSDNSNPTKKEKPFFSKKNESKGTNNFFFQKKEDKANKKKKDTPFLSKKEAKLLYKRELLTNKEDKAKIKRKWKSFQSKRRKQKYGWDSKETDAVFFAAFPHLRPMETMEPLPLEQLKPIESNLEPVELIPLEPVQAFSPSDFEPNAIYDGLDAEDFLDLEDLTYNQFQYAIQNTTDPVVKKQLLDKAKASAKKRLKHFKGDEGKAKVEEHHKETSKNVSLKTTLGSNHLPITNTHIDIAYDAIAMGATTSPAELIALWFKEGSGIRKLDIPMTGVTNVQNAKSNWRSYAYFINLGADHYINYTLTSTDNAIAATNDADALANERAFKERVNQQYRAGRLPRDISAEINASITVTGAPGSYTVKPTNKFYALSLMLMSAFYQEKKEQVQGNSLGKNGEVNPQLELAIAEAKRLGNEEDLKKYEALKTAQENQVDPGLVYISWNIKNFETKFLPSAERHRQEPEFESQFGGTPDLSQWALETKPKEHEYKQPRENAMRYKYYVEVFNLVFNGD